MTRGVQIGALVGLAVMFALGCAYSAGKASGGVLVVVADCEPGPPIKKRKPFRV